MKTYVFVGGLTVEQALEKVKKYYPNYYGNQHFYAVLQQPLKGCVCNKGGDIFEYCFEDYFIKNGFTRIDKEETMDKYYKITVIRDYVVKNLVFQGDTFSTEETVDINTSKIYNKLDKWGLSKLTSIIEITEEEYDKFKNKKMIVCLNDDYNAIITNGGINVGCQTFTHESILNLAKELEKFLDKG